jgi:hypothetical protein
MLQLLAVGRQRSHQQSLPVWQSLNPLLRRAASIAPPPSPPRDGEGLRWALGRGRTVTVGRPSVVWLCGLDS